MPTLFNIESLKVMAGVLNEYLLNEESLCSLSIWPALPTPSLKLFPDLENHHSFLKAQLSHHISYATSPTLLPSPQQNWLLLYFHDAMEMSQVDTTVPYLSNYTAP